MILDAWWVLRRVGDMLATERRRRGWTLRQTERAAQDKPASITLTYSTVSAHERGDIKTIAKLHAHFAAFDWDPNDTLRAALHPHTVSADDLTLVAALRALSPEDRAMLVKLASRLARLRPSRPAPTPPGTPTPDPAVSSGGSRRAAGTRRR